MQLHRVLGDPWRASPWNSDQLLREELFSVERLEQHAASLAAAQQVTAKPLARRSLAARLKNNESVLLAAYRTLGAAVGDGQTITPAAEWLLDNYHLVEEQTRDIRQDLPPGFYRQLPKLAGGPLAGYPRVFGIAWAYVAHSDSRFDPESLRRFVRAYQKVEALTIGELWAVTITLRIVLVENLRRAAERIISSRVARAEADEIADRLLGVNGFAADPEALIRRHEDHVTSSAAFVVQVVKRLRDQDPRVTPALKRLEDQLAAQGTTSDAMVRDEHQRQGASNVTVRNIITSMRLMSSVNWPEVLEDVSLVDQVLRGASDFARMDFATRNLYRSAIEDLARGSVHSELEIARRVVAHARASGAESSRERDPGYHLLARGRGAFERAVGYRRRFRNWPGRFRASIGPIGYVGAVLLVTASVLTVPLWMLQLQAVPGAWLALLGVLGVIPAMDVAVALVNRAVTREFGATLLPALSLREGIPADLRTMVVVPALLTSREALEAQIERLEVHYLASSHGELHFALLSDWTDAATEKVEGDDALLELAVDGIARLNRLHDGPAQGARFYLFHRRRVWSAGEGAWMGWERKRGKLHELNRLLRGATDTTFIAGDSRAAPIPPQVRYVITLDADTRLPREAARRLVGKIAHPLNRPRFDEATGRIVEGYAVLQPRVTASLPIGNEGSTFQRIFSSMTGIDPYDTAVSDVYQDLFGEGSYAGKGIYEVDAFEAALAGRVPDGTLLSHDLFEGTFARAGLVSDIEVVEEFPARYDVAAARSHRWARGDWQLLPWILGRGDAARGGSRSLPLIGRWKMLDNLRRSQSSLAAVLALLTGWVLPPAAAVVWTAFISMTIAAPALLPVLASIIPRRRGIVVRSHLRALGADLWTGVLQIVLTVTFLAHQAALMLDAIGRTLYRLVVSRRHLLEWMSAAQAQERSHLGLAEFYRLMSASVTIGVLAALAIGAAGQGAGWVALPFVLLWIAAPAIARYISVSPLVAGRVQVSAEDARALRLIARRTWRFFETFVTAADHHLPPDNFQEDPEPVLAHRTSPTNLGLYLLCAVSARDFGWIGAAETLERLEATLATMDRLQRFRGHFYNWYDTRDLRPLDPKYVSSVDSGNLAAHLIAVANACRKWRGETASDFAPGAAPLAGADDAMQLMRAALKDLPDSRRRQIVTREQVTDGLDALAAALGAAAQATQDFAARVGDCATVATTLADGARALASEQSDAGYADVLFWADAARNSIESCLREVTQSEATSNAINTRLGAVEAASRAMAMEMDFGFLLDGERKLLAIGYQAPEGTLDPSCYDLLASEARLASFFAIAKNDVPTRHWFRLGREVTSIGHGAALLSWSGSMFEYLMPSLVMRAPTGSLLEQTNRWIVRRQIRYGNSLNVPWGVSESAYSARDLEFTYQYSNFGVPGLGLKRGLSESVVVAPYATGLAAMVDPQAAARNYERLATLGARGRFGFYEALDYTRSRLPEGASVVIVKAFMAHHQGMTIVAIGNVIFDGRMRARFHAEACVQATELLLQERTPRDVSMAHPRAEEVATAAHDSGEVVPQVRRLHSPHDATPQTQLLSNGRYAVMITSAGSGYSRWRGLALTRWRADTTCDDSGSYVYLRDANDGSVWSAGYQPSGVEPDRYEVTFTEDRAEIIRRDAALTTTLHVVVSPEDDAEVRRISIVNSGDEVREIDVTSYCELVLAAPAADDAHPAFSKLFVQTEYFARAGAVLATRRRRSPDEREIWVSQHVVVEGEALGPLQFETDRARFLGRGRTGHDPIAVMDGERLSNTSGTVLDPVFALRRRVRVPAGATARIAFWTCVATSRTGVLDLIDKHSDVNAFARATTLAWTQAQVQLRHLGITQEEANLFQRLAGHVLYADASMRPPSESIQRGGGTRAAIWAQGISGDLPLVLLRIDHVEDIAIVRQLLRAHEYWRLKRFAVDLVIVNERASSYVQDLQAALDTAVRMSQSRGRFGADLDTDRAARAARGSVFVLRTDLISAETRSTLPAIARAVFSGQRGSLEEQLERRAQSVGAAPLARQIKVPTEQRSQLVAPSELQFFNGLGGFSPDGREYVTRIEPGQATPAPWINVIANPQFGFQVSVEGGGYSWAVNSRENQLTPWSNDPVGDPCGEALYVRDEETGDLWGPTIAPIRDESAPYSVRHGQGYSRFEHEAHGIALELTVFVPLHEPVKIARLRIRNQSLRSRRLSVTAFVEWVLGTAREASAPFVVTEVDGTTGAMFARNPCNGAFRSRVAFADLGGRQTDWTGDRREFLGRHGRRDRPAALTSGERLSKRTGAGLDPCAVLQAPISLDSGEATDLVFLLGEAESVSTAQALVARYRMRDLDAELAAVKAFWSEALGAVQVTTPDRSMDILLNRWLLYQTLACRMWARSAFYQAGGAYGFRDQLQDSMALVIAKPAIARAHLLRAAGRQFPEGDVQHWWLPPAGQGVRTRISDDRVWLAYVAAHYLDTTGDLAILDENVAFIEGAKLEPGEHDEYFEPVVSDDSATFFEHCARGLDAALAVGEHRLPLIGTGDWNDGMNRVGELGRGESVWLGWFLHATLCAFATVATARKEDARAARWLEHATALGAALDRDGWDGGWYRRGYFDDGTPFGSAADAECRIDSIAQSWSVISGAGNPARALEAMAAVSEKLIRNDDALALLFTPPFDRTPLDPGYVKGYPPGIRENGGQYTHAAAWSIIAFAKLGQGEKAAELFALLNPINRTRTRTGLQRYKVEPYVVAADVYSVPPHVGRGGWTWYTGSAAWLYRAGLESILGFQRQGSDLLLSPCIPKTWPRFEIRYQHASARYDIVVENPNAVNRGVVRARLDGVPLAPGPVRIPLLDDGATHTVQVTLG